MFKWSNALAVYIPSVDDEHREIYRLASDLHAALLGDATIAQIQAKVRTLVAETAGHFAHEEEMMQATRYLSLGWHRQQHQSATKKVLAFQQEVDEGDREAAMELLKYLSDFLKDHMHLTDRIMGAYLRNHERAHRRIAS